MESLFVYGTLKYPMVQKKVIGRRINKIKDVLKGYKKSTIKIENEIYPIIVPSANSSVNGLVILVSKKELKLIDEYETDAYKREKVILKSRKNAWVYRK